MVAEVVGGVTGIVIYYCAYKHTQKQQRAQLMAKVVDAYLSLETYLQHEKIEKKDNDRLKCDLLFTQECLLSDMKYFLAIENRSKTQESTMDKLGVLLTILENSVYYSENKDELNKALKFSSYQTMNEV